MATPGGTLNWNKLSGSGIPSCQSPKRYSRLIPPGCRISIRASWPLDLSTSRRTSVKSDSPGNSFGDAEDRSLSFAAGCLTPLGRQRRTAWSDGTPLCSITSSLLQRRDKSTFPVRRARGVRQSELSLHRCLCYRMVVRNVKPHGLCHRRGIVFSRGNRSPTAYGPADGNIPCLIRLARRGSLRYTAPEIQRGVSVHCDSDARATPQSLSLNSGHLLRVFVKLRGRHKSRQEKPRRRTANYFCIPSRLDCIRKARMRPRCEITRGNLLTQI